jgi:nucleoid-associated protein YgaU
VRRLLMGLVSAALVIAVVAFILWSNGAPPSKTAPPAPPPQAALPAPSPQPANPPQPSPTVPSFDIVKVDPSGHAVIAGRAAPGSKVTVLDGDKPLGDVTADDRGEWVLVPINPIAPGERQLTLEATDPTTGAKTKSTDTVALAVAPPTPGGTGAGTVAVLLPSNPNQPAQALQTPNSGGALSLDTAEYSQDGKLLLSGHATPGATLRLYADNQLVATVKAGLDGKWSSVSPHPKTSGKIELRVDELGADGSVAQRVAEPFEPQTAAAAAGPIGSYTVQPGNSLWLIARKAYGNGTQYTVLFGANKEHIRDPNLIYPGQIITVPKS